MDIVALNLLSKMFNLHQQAAFISNLLRKMYLLMVFSIHVQVFILDFVFLFHPIYSYMHHSAIFTDIIFLIWKRNLKQKKL